MKKIIFLFLALSVFSCMNRPDPFLSGDNFFEKSAENGTLSNEALRRCHNFVKGWLKHADKDTGLIPRNLDGSIDIWNAKDAAADNYPFMVLTAALTDKELLDVRLLKMLKTETQLTSRLGNLPDTYSFIKRTFQYEDIDIRRLIFGGSEYIKDGLLPLTEWLGQSPWSDRMIGILDDIWENAPVETRYGIIPSKNQEVNGEMLQTLARIYWMTGKQKYLDFAIRLGDYYLFDHHPTRDESKLRLRDHGCEILSGLTELYAAVNYAAPEKKKAYKEPIRIMLDRVLEVGRNEHGLLYNSINPQTGEHDDRLCDTWGYNYNGFYTVYLIDNIKAYRQAVIFALSNIKDHYENYDWESGSADGDADAIESALNLYNREPIETAAHWIDHQIQTMWSKQKEDGIIEGWHGDGNFARTSIMYALWKSKGITLQPWREDIRLGAEEDNKYIYITCIADSSWQGDVIFDIPRHRVNMNLPLDYPRINQFPEWFTVDFEKEYIVYRGTHENKQTCSGEDLSRGLPIQIESGVELRFVIKKSD